MRRLTLFFVGAALVASIPAQAGNGREREDEQMRTAWVESRMNQLGEMQRPEAVLLTESGNPADRANCEWFAKVLKKNSSVKVGTSRGRLLKMYTPMGGLSTPVQESFGVKDCPYIQVDVHFKIVGRPERDGSGRITMEKSSRDVVAGISKPYLAFPSID